MIATVQAPILLLNGGIAAGLVLCHETKPGSPE